MTTATRVAHTPGPWTAADRFGNFGDHNRSERDAPTGQISRFSYSVRDTEGFIVAHCTNPLVTMQSERSEANARLIAEAPNLLAACIEAVEQITDHIEAADLADDDDHPLAGLREQLRAAIAKAEGR